MPRTYSVVSLVMLATVGAGSASSQTAECKRPLARRFADGETVVVADVAKAPCRVEFPSTPIVIRADSALDVADIGNRLAQGPDGRFYTYASRAGEVSVWSPQGRFLRNIGRSGRGPGEFATGLKNIMFDRAGNVYIADNNRQWSIFSPAYELRRAVSAAGTGISANQNVVLDDGTLVSAQSTSQGAGSFFRVYDFQRVDSAPLAGGRGGAGGAYGPALLRSFGPAPAGGSPYARNRPVSKASGSTFWAGPAEGSGIYSMELWRTDGTLLRTIRREVTWYPKPSAAPARGTGGVRIPPPEMEVLHDDGTGLLFVTLVIANDTYRQLTGITDRAEQRKAMDSMVDVYFEVIDVNAGVILATSKQHPSTAMSSLPLGFLTGRRAYRRDETPDGFAIMRVIELKLVAQ